jgi:hypothetical protein
MLMSVGCSVERLFHPTNLVRSIYSQLAAALIKLKAPKETCMAVIPMGTANDFATAAGIPEDPWEALELAVTDTAYPIDVGMVNNHVSCCRRKLKQTSSYHGSRCQIQVSVS